MAGEEAHFLEAPERSIQRPVRGQQAVIAILRQMLRDLIAVELLGALAIEIRGGDTDGALERNERAQFATHR